MGEPFQPDESTVEAERDDAGQPHVADRPPTGEEENDAERAASETGADRQDVAQHIDEMNKLGANVKGEGEIEEHLEH